MRIVNPSFGLQLQSDAPKAAAGGATDWSKDPIAIISNSKPNAPELLQGVRKLLRERRPIDNIDYLFKDSAAQPAPDDLIEEVSKKYKGAIVALAD